MDETQALVLIAEVAISIAGFSGIATALDARPGGTVWAQGRRARFVYMLSQSGIALFASLLTLTSLYRLPVGTYETLWTSSSIVWALFAAVGTSLGFYRGRALPTPDGAERFLGRAIVVGFASLVLLNLYNAAVWKMFWPFLAGLVGNLAFAFIQFMRIVVPLDESQGEN